MTQKLTSHPRYFSPYDRYHSRINIVPGLYVVAAKAKEQLTATGMKLSSFLKLKQIIANNIHDARRCRSIWAAR